jgi:hypothetical protein
MWRLALGTVLVVAAVSGCEREVWVTPVAVLPPHPSNCPVNYRESADPGTKVLATLRCTDGFLSVGEFCAQLVRQKVCQVGGDVAFGAHREGNDLIVTVGATPPPQAAPPPITAFATAPIVIGVPPPPEVKPASSAAPSGSTLPPLPPP